MRAFPGLSLATLLLGACAAPPSQAPSTFARTQTHIQIGDAGYTIELTRTLDAWVATLPLPVEEVWAAVPGTYDRLGLTGGGLLEPGRRAYGFRDRLPSRIARRSPSAYLDCGRGLAGPIADQYEVRLFVFTTVEPDGDGSRVSTLIDASAAPREVRGDPVACTTTGALERLILEELGTAGGRSKASGSE